MVSVSQFTPRRGAPFKKKVSQGACPQTPASWHATRSNSKKKLPPPFGKTYIHPCLVDSEFLIWECEDNDTASAPLTIIKSVWLQFIM